jgi:hypothetical protein
VLQKGCLFCFKASSLLSELSFGIIILSDTLRVMIQKPSRAKNKYRIDTVFSLVLQNPPTSSARYAALVVGIGIASVFISVFEAGTVIVGAITLLPFTPLTAFGRDDWGDCTPAGAWHFDRENDTIRCCYTCRWLRPWSSVAFVSVHPLLLSFS